MEVRMESAAQMAQHNRTGKRKGKRGRPNGPKALKPKDALNRLAHELDKRFDAWEERIANDPMSFAEVEREVHEYATQGTGRLVASLLARATRRPAYQRNVEQTIAAAEAPLGAAEKNDAC